ncbi:MAG TPA: nucleoside monophosphate kinase [Candidatus Saccharimonadales bacterium]|nr:nucleoside monophosphate kinase [Candidatus Saccharimonadales bacterium]
MNEQAQKIVNWLGTGSINLFGKPFSGKDTQGEILAEALGAPLIGGGDILRSHHDPAQIEKIMASGGLIPSDYFFDMVLPYLSRPEFRGKPLVLDALGRSAGEEETILRAAEHSGHPLRAVIVLNVSDEEVWRRYEAAKKLHDRDGRDDDQAETLRTRLKKFQDKTVPVIEAYRQKGLLVEVNGAQSRDAVEQEILAALIRFAKI